MPSFESPVTLPTYRVCGLVGETRTSCGPSKGGNPGRGAQVRAPSVDLNSDTVKVAKSTASTYSDSRFEGSTAQSRNPFIARCQGSPRLSVRWKPGLPEVASTLFPPARATPSLLLVKSNPGWGVTSLARPIWSPRDANESDRTKIAKQDGARIGSPLSRKPEWLRAAPRMRWLLQMKVLLLRLACPPSAPCLARARAGGPRCPCPRSASQESEHRKG